MSAATQATPEIQLPPDQEVDGGIRKHAIAKKNIFNLETMERESKKVPYSFVEPQVVEHTQNFTAEQLLEALKLYTRRQAWTEARNSIEGADAAAVTKFLASFRTLPMYAKIADRKEQTTAIMTFIKSTPFLMEQLREMAAEANKETEEEEAPE